MTTRTEREKNKRQHEKHLAILMELLREDQNKYCADCRAKGPRWASWNLGIFVCITCAGIHRNLGVHISKVKSVNLDAWTQEQITNMQEWGNKRAAQYYEYHLPSDFKRPHGDSSLEQFIRSKYEKKLYMSKEGPPPCEIKQEKSKEKSKKSDSNKKIQQVSRPEVTKPVKTNVNIKETKTPVITESSATGDLLSLGQPPVSQGNTLLSLSKTKEVETTADLLNFGSSPFPPIPNNPTPSPAQPAVSSPQGFAFDLAQTMSTPASSVPKSVPSPNCPAPSSGQTNVEEDLFKDDITGGNQSTKDSIMALYQPTQQQSNRQVFGVPGGVYLPQQQQTQPKVGALNQASMAPQYNTQFNAQQQQQQQMYQLNQVQQQMAKLGFSQQPQMTTSQAMQNGQVIPNNRVVPNPQVIPNYNYNQAVPPGMTPYHNGPTPYTTTPLGRGSGNWMPLKTGTTFPPAQQQQQQQQQMYLTTGPAVPGFTMYQAQGGMPSGQTLSTNLWK